MEDLNIKEDLGEIRRLLFLIAMQNREERLMREAQLPGTRGKEIAESDEARLLVRKTEESLLGKLGASRGTKPMYG